MTRNIEVVSLNCGKEIRGDGVGSVLMDSFEERAHASGSTAPSFLAENSIVLRAANPTFDEGLAFARYLDEAAASGIQILLWHSGYPPSCEGTPPT